jgi:hypothetical protein
MQAAGPCAVLLSSSKVHIVTSDNTVTFILDIAHILCLLNTQQTNFTTEALKKFHTIHFIPRIQAVFAEMARRDFMCRMLCISV